MLFSSKYTFYKLKNTEKILQIYNTPDNYMFSVKPNYVEINNNGFSGMVISLLSLGIITFYVPDKSAFNCK